jgi:uncharacterized protein (TIGR02996 family)
MPHRAEALPMSTTRDALEAALAAEPDDRALHAAYADLLIEDGDPRGEFIQLQLAAEDRDQPADRLRAIEQQAHTICRQHENEWLGLLAPFVNPPRGPSVGAMVAENVAVTFRRGWVHRIEVGRLTDEIRDAIAAAPIARLLAELVIETNTWLETDRQRGGTPYPAGLVSLSTEERELADSARRTTLHRANLEPLANSPNVRNLRRLELGIEDWWHYSQFDADIGQLVRETPRLEHLKITAGTFIPAPVFGAELPYLHSFHVMTDANRLPVAILGVNSSLRNLTRLYLELVGVGPGDEEQGLVNQYDPIRPDELQAFCRSPHLAALRHLALRLPGFGDAGVGELIASGLINRLHGLDLCRCRITDEGAELLARCPAVGRLEYLHLDNNYLSEAGIDALASAGVQVSRRQFFAEGWEPEGDIPF